MYIISRFVTQSESNITVFIGEFHKLDCVSIRVCIALVRSIKRKDNRYTIYWTHRLTTSLTTMMLICYMYNEPHTGTNNIFDSFCCNCFIILSVFIQRYKKKSKSFCDSCCSYIKIDHL